MKELKRIRREASIHAVARILSAGQPTNFAFEAACRHGLRSGMCLDGQPWGNADQKADVLVGEALRRLGAERPTWLQGQPDYVSEYGAERVFCSHCGKRIPEEDHRSSNGRPVKYCSDLCSDAAYAVRYRLGVRRELTVRTLARQAARGGGAIREQIVDCEHCHRPFLIEGRDRTYCSRQCKAAAQTVHPPRPCANCGEIFKPKDTGRAMTKYCSRKCSGLAQRVPQTERQCESCGTAFTPERPDKPTRFCSRSCFQKSRARPA